MRVNVSAEGFSLTAPVVDYARRHMEVLGRIAPKVGTVTVKVEHRANQYRLRAFVQVDSHSLSAELSCAELYEGIDRLSREITKTVRMNGACNCGGCSQHGKECPGH
jgi:ribosome-associated translation inhibitor RaiA